ncbi:MAG: transcription termination factor Rho [Lachnospiraceae bacterium]|nr:transcription termination factor Rho [Lachnospiraceae bacterium]
MRDKLETLPLMQLRELAKSQGIKNITVLRKSELIDKLCEAAGESAAQPAPAAETPVQTAPQAAETQQVSEPQPQRTYYTRTNNQQGYQPRNYERNQGERTPASADPKSDLQDLDSGIEANGILEVMPDGFGFIRCENFLPGENDVYVAPSQIRRFNMKTGDIIRGSRRVKTATEKFAALLYITTINGYPVQMAERRPNFEDLTPIFPDERLNLEVRGEKNTTAMRVMDLLAPIGKGQRGMIVSPPKAGKTTLLKQVAKAITRNYPDMHLIILLIDERPEEVTDIKESVIGENVEVIYSTFGELPDRHKRVSEMVIERAKRLVEHGRDVMILLDSITRLARAYNLVVSPSGRTLSGGLDPAALHMPKRFFGAARNMREGGSLTILATALVDTGSRMDDVVYEEFKGTGNMELVLDRKLSEKRIFPAIDILKSGTRRDDLLLTKEEAEAVDSVRKATNSLKPEESVEKVLDLFARTKTNREFVDMAKKMKFF